MKKEKIILAGWIALCTVCAALAAGCSQYGQEEIGITSGRARALTGVAAGLLSLIIGGLSLARAAGVIGSGNGRNGAILALVLGLTGMILSVIHLGGSTGGFGTGGGRLGAIVALVLSLIGINLGGMVLYRSRRSGNRD